MLKMDLADALLIAQEAMVREIDALEAKNKGAKRVNIDRVLRIREVRKAYRLLSAEFDRITDTGATQSET